MQKENRKKLKKKSVNWKMLMLFSAQLRVVALHIQSLIFQLFT